MTNIIPTMDIRTVTELKRNTKEILKHIHSTGRPVILTVNGKPDSVLMDVREYERFLQAEDHSQKGQATEKQARGKRTRSGRPGRG